MNEGLLPVLKQAWSEPRLLWMKTAAGTGAGMSAIHADKGALAGQSHSCYMPPVAAGCDGSFRWSITRRDAPIGCMLGPVWVLDPSNTSSTNNFFYLPYLSFWLFFRMDVHACILAQLPVEATAAGGCMSAELRVDWAKPRTKRTTNSKLIYIASVIWNDLGCTAHAAPDGRINSTSGSWISVKLSRFSVLPI